MNSLRAQLSSPIRVDIDNAPERVDRARDPNLRGENSS